MFATMLGAYHFVKIEYVGSKVVMSGVANKDTTKIGQFVCFWCLRPIASVTSVRLRS
jgi:hypothetical protein